MSANDAVDGGLTELVEAKPTDAQGRALSAHKSQQSYERIREADYAPAISGDT